MKHLHLVSMPLNHGEWHHFLKSCPVAPEEAVIFRALAEVSLWDGKRNPTALFFLVAIVNLKTLLLFLFF